MSHGRRPARVGTGRMESVPRHQEPACSGRGMLCHPSREADYAHPDGTFLPGIRSLGGGTSPRECLTDLRPCERSEGSAFVAKNRRSRFLATLGMTAGGTFMSVKGEKACGQNVPCTTADIEIPRAPRGHGCRQAISRRMVALWPGAKGGECQARGQHATG